MDWTLITIVIIICFTIAICTVAIADIVKEKIHEDIFLEYMLFNEKDEGEN